MTDFLLNLLFPPFCCHCQKVGKWLCLPCQNQISFLTCPKVILPRESPLSDLLVMAKYQGPMRSLIQALKFGHFKAGGQLLAELIDWSLLLPKVDLITWVPLHRRRLRQRGYDQAGEIAKNLAKILKLPCVSLIERVYYLDPQSGIKDKSARQSRLAGSFGLTPLAQKLASQTDASAPTTSLDLLLIDDVYTTGATLSEAALTLRKIESIKTVIGLCVAH